MKLHYKITLEDGMVAESTFEGDPIDYQIDSDLFPPKIKQMLSHIDVDMEYEHFLLAKDGWGARDPKMVHDLDINDFQHAKELHEGMIMDFSLPNGDSVPGALVRINEKTISVDFNHPFAGQNLTFNFKRVE